MNAKLGAKFWINVFLGFFGGLGAGFASGLILGGVKSAAVSFALGLGTGLASGYGILFRFPKDNASDGAIGRYAFWPALMPGLTIAETIYALYPMTITFSGILGFVIALVLHFRHDFGAKSAN